MTKIKNSGHTAFQQRDGITETLITCCWGCIMARPFWKLLGTFLKSETYVPDIPLPDIYPNRCLTFCTLRFTLFPSDFLRMYSLCTGHWWFKSLGHNSSFLNWRTCLTWLGGLTASWFKHWWTEMSSVPLSPLSGDLQLAIMNTWLVVSRSLRSKAMYMQH